MAKLVFARHGESEWNKANLFTGWADVDLSEKGVRQAIDAGRLIKDAGIEFDVAFTSVLKRAIKTTNLALEFSDQLWVPVQKSWRLNERHYGGLTGKNKAEAAEKFGKEQVQNADYKNNSQGQEKLLSCFSEDSELYTETRKTSQTRMLYLDLITEGSLSLAS